jgi:hypothetical protein
MVWYVYTAGITPGFEHGAELLHTAGANGPVPTPEFWRSSIDIGLADDKAARARRGNEAFMLALETD